MRLRNGLKSFAMGSFVKHIVVERAVDYKKKSAQLFTT